MPVREMTPEEAIERFGNAKVVTHRRPRGATEPSTEGPNYGDIADGIARSCEMYLEGKLNYDGHATKN
jgi:hypothetical protein